MRALAAMAILAGVFVAWALMPPFAVHEIGPAAQRASVVIRSWGPWGVVGSIGLMVIHSFVPFPAEVIAIANGMAYGPLWGTAVTWVGAMLGASVAFGTARVLGRPFVLRRLSLRRQRQIFAWSEARSAVPLLVARLIPLIAFNLINYAAALTGVSWWTFLWTTAIGILPFTILLSVLGDRALATPLWAWALLAAMLLTAWVVRLRLRPSTDESRKAP